MGKKTSKQIWIEDFLAIFDQYCDETGEMENGRRIVRADPLSMSKWLKGRKDGKKAIPPLK